MDLPNGATVLDTGGWGLRGGETAEDLVGAVEEQVEFAISMADVIVFLLDGRTGPLPLDFEIAALLRKTGKRILAAVNKIDHGGLDGEVSAFASLGVGEGPLGISAEHGRGIEELEKLLFGGLDGAEGEDGSDRPVTLVLLGAPNVGKSSLANALLGERRMIVSPVAGTTRDTIRGDFIYADAGGRSHSLRLWDTAGLRKTAKMGSSVEYFSAVRARRAMAEADVVFLVLDAARGLTKWDKKIADEVADAGKNLAVIVNKWDLARTALLQDALPNYEDAGEFRRAFEEALRRELFSWPEIPILFLSAQSGESIGTIGETALALAEHSSQPIGTGVLNRLLGRCLEEHAPSSRNGRAFKLYYALQISSQPPVIRFYCNDGKLFGADQESRLRRRIIEHFTLGGCPLRIDCVSKPRRRLQKNFVGASPCGGEN
jgi:GTP-binding protein